MPMRSWIKGSFKFDYLLKYITAKRRSGLIWHERLSHRHWSSSKWLRNIMPSYLSLRSKVQIMAKVLAHLGFHTFTITASYNMGYKTGFSSGFKLSGFCDLLSGFVRCCCSFVRGWSICLSRLFFWCSHAAKESQQVQELLPKLLS